MPTSALSPDLSVEIPINIVNFISLFPPPSPSNLANPYSRPAGLPVSLAIPRPHSSFEPLPRSRSERRPHGDEDSQNEDRLESQRKRAMSHQERHTAPERVQAKQLSHSTSTSRPAGPRAPATTLSSLASYAVPLKSAPARPTLPGRARTMPMKLRASNETGASNDTAALTSYSEDAHITASPDPVDEDTPRLKPPKNPFDWHPSDQDQSTSEVDEAVKKLVVPPMKTPNTAQIAATVDVQTFDIFSPSGPSGRYRPRIPEELFDGPSSVEEEVIVKKQRAIPNEDLIEYEEATMVKSTSKRHSKTGDKIDRRHTEEEPANDIPKPRASLPNDHTTAPRRSKGHLDDRSLSESDATTAVESHLSRAGNEIDNLIARLKDVHSLDPFPHHHKDRSARSSNGEKDDTDNAEEVDDAIPPSPQIPAVPPSSRAASAAYSLSQAHPRPGSRAPSSSTRPRPRSEGMSSIVEDRDEFNESPKLKPKPANDEDDAPSDSSGARSGKRPQSMYALGEKGPAEDTSGLKLRPVTSVKARIAALEKSGMNFR